MHWQALQRTVPCHLAELSYLREDPLFTSAQCGDALNALNVPRFRYFLQTLLKQFFKSNPCPGQSKGVWEKVQPPSNNFKNENIGSLCAETSEHMVKGKFSSKCQLSLPTPTHFFLSLSIPLSGLCQGIVLNRSSSGFVFYYVSLNIFSIPFL